MDILVKNCFDRERVTVKCSGDGKTQQQFGKDADINNIMKRYEKTGLLVDPSVIRSGSPQFGDFSSVPTYREALDRINLINSEFMKLNPGVRAKFNNDPGEMLNFISDSKNYPEAVKMGILDKSVLPKVETKVATDVATGDLNVAK